MKTICTVGLGFDIQQLRQENRPWTEWFWTDGGRLSGDRFDRATWENFYHEMTAIAHLPALAPMLRGDEASNRVLDLFADVVQTTSHQSGSSHPTIVPCVDTAALGDRVDGPFDFASEAHCEIAWIMILEPCLRVFRDRLERTADGRVPIFWWSIQPWIGQGWQHRDQAQQLLNHVQKRMAQQGYGGPAMIVDQASWPLSATVWGKHTWFDAPSISHSVCTHNGVTIGVCVPGFRNYTDGQRQIPRRDGQTLLDGFNAAHAKNADYLLIEGFTDIEECAGPYRCEPGHVNSWEPITKYLDIISAQIGPVVNTEPIPEPEPSPNVGGKSMIAIANAPIFSNRVITGWLTGEFDGTAVKLSKPLPGQDGKLTSGGPYLSIQPDGSYQGRPSPGGGYEQMPRSGSDVVCSYQHEGVQYVHVVPYKELNA